MYPVVKRMGDIVIALFGLILLSPVLLIAMLAIRIDSEGPIIFKQQRLGKNGKVFEIYKFRSMCVGAEKGGVYEKKGDKRVTKVGRIIRKTSIDEFPQFMNILKGDMSLIGPRPPLTYHPWPFEEYSDEQKRMFDVRPGVTGWAQVNGRKDVEWNRRIELSVEYVEKMSLTFDLLIFFKTISKVIRMKDNVNTHETVDKKSNKTNE
ncbi:sugar transferase [Eubacteriaceae bacterium ES3]|nr:sugar transferase [Eubacteriaceae bacterium ES3]